MTEPDSLPRPPEPLPAPTAVTGWKPADRGGRGWLWIVLVAVLGVVALAGAGVLAVRFVRDRVVLPLAQINGLDSALTARALAEYPGYSFVEVESGEGELTAGETETVNRVFVTLKNRDHPGFRYTAIYTAPSSVASDPARYENLDDFLKEAVSPGQPADSFVAMWMRTRPTDIYGYIIELGESTDATRTYEVAYSVPAKAGAPYDPKTVYYAYAPATDVWTETAKPRDALEVYEDSLVDTATAVARALPAFEVVGAAQLPNASWVAVIRHKTYPKLRVVTDAQYLTPDDAGDDIVVMFGEHADVTRANSFIRMWTAAHPRAIIDFIDFDPDAEGRTDIVDVLYANSVDDVGVYGKEKYVRLRYTKSHTWVPAK